MRKKIAITFPYIHFFSGGAETQVATLRDKFLERGYHAEIVSIPFKWYPPHELWEQMLMWKTVDLSESNGEKIDLLIGTKFPSYFARHENKILWLIHQHREAYDLQTKEWSWFYKTNPAYPFLQQFRDADTAALKEAKKILTISQNVSKRLEMYNGLPSEPLYHPPRLTGQFYCSEFGDYVLSIGRLDSMKRLDLLIESMRHVDPKVQCIIGGTGVAREKERLEKLVERYGLKHRVRFLGFVSDEDMLKLLSECLCVYYAPIDEDYGMVTLEAFMSQKPIVTAVDSGGVLEFAEDGVNAAITEPEAERIGAAINALYHNKAKAKEMGHSGYERVKDISWDNVVDQLLMYGGLA